VAEDTAALASGTAPSRKHKVICTECLALNLPPLALLSMARLPACFQSRPVVFNYLLFLVNVTIFGG